MKTQKPVGDDVFSSFIVFGFLLLWSCPPLVVPEQGYMQRAELWSCMCPPGFIDVFSCLQHILTPFAQCNSAKQQHKGSSARCNVYHLKGSY